MMASATAGRLVGPKHTMATSTRKPGRPRQLVVYAQSVPKRMMHSPTVFPGEDAPGTGLRHFPEDDDISDETEHASQMAAHAKRTKQGNFQYKSSKECYEEFPTLVRSSTLLHPSQTFQPAELDLEAGPLSGHRQRPNAVDLEDKKRPRIPGEAHSQDILLREVITRRMQC